MSYFSNPKKTEGGDQQIVVSDEDVAQLLEQILQELRIMNMHLTLLTDSKITKEELEL